VDGGILLAPPTPRGPSFPPAWRQEGWRPAWWGFSRSARLRSSPLTGVRGSKRTVTPFVLLPGSPLNGVRTSPLARHSPITSSTRFWIDGRAQIGILPLRLEAALPERRDLAGLGAACGQSKTRVGAHYVIIRTIDGDSMKEWSGARHLLLTFPSTGGRGTQAWSGSPAERLRLFPCGRYIG